MLYFATRKRTIELPKTALARGDQVQQFKASLWLERERVCVALT